MKERYGHENPENQCNNSRTVLSRISQIAKFRLSQSGWRSFPGRSQQRRHWLMQKIRRLIESGALTAPDSAASAAVSSPRAIALVACIGGRGQIVMFLHSRHVLPPNYY